MSTKRQAGLVDDRLHLEYKWLPAIGPYCSQCGLPPPKIPSRTEIDTQDSFSIIVTDEDAQIIREDAEQISMGELIPSTSTDSSQLSEIMPSTSDSAANAVSILSTSLEASDALPCLTLNSRDALINSCFPLVWPDDLNEMPNGQGKMKATSRLEIVRIIVRRMNENGLKENNDYVEVAEETLRRYPILKMKSVTESEVFVSQMKKCHANHIQYLNRALKKKSDQRLEMKCHEELIEAMQQEMLKPAPSINVLKLLLEQCRKKRHEEAKKTASVVEHLKMYPALRNNQLMLRELEILMGVSITNIKERWILALPSLLRYFSLDVMSANNKTNNEQTVLALINVATHFINEKNKAKGSRKAKEQLNPDEEQSRTNHIIQIFPENTTLSVTLPQADEPPRLIAIGSADMPNLNVYIHMDNKAIYAGEPIEGLLMLMSIYWVFNVEYPADAKFAFIFVAAVLFGKKVESSYKKLRTVVTLLEELEIN